MKLLFGAFRRKRAAGVEPAVAEEGAVTPLFPIGYAREEFERDALVADHVVGGDYSMTFGEISGRDPYSKILHCAEVLRKRMIKSEAAARDLSALDGEAERRRLKRMRRLAAELSSDVGERLQELETVAVRNAETSEAASDLMVEVDAASMEMLSASCELAGKVARIAEILTIIGDLAARSRLLSLNAAIEAARAGDHGKGFAVVADEVQMMARQTADATARIRGDLASLEEASGAAAALVADARRKLSVGGAASDAAPAGAIESVAAIRASSLEMRRATGDAGGSLRRFLREMNRERGVLDDRVLIAQTADFDGPLRHFGRAIQAGVAAAFAEINRKGGVHGRELVLQSKSDSYNPDLVNHNFRAFSHSEDGVFAFVGSTGTWTSIALCETANAAGAPVFGPSSGADALRDPRLDHVFNCRASFAAETEAWLEEIRRRDPNPRIVCVYQADPGGHALLAKAEAAAARRGLAILARGALKRIEDDVGETVAAILPAEPDYVLCCSVGASVTNVKKALMAAGCDATLFVTSFIAADVVAEGLGPKVEGLVRSQSLPFFERDPRSILARRFRDAMKAIDREDAIDGASLEGYVAGRVVIAGVEAVGRDLRRAAICDVLRDGLAIDLDDRVVQYGREDNLGIEQSLLTEWDGRGAWRAPSGAGAAVNGSGRST